MAQMAGLYQACRETNTDAKKTQLGFHLISSVNELLSQHNLPMTPLRHSLHGDPSSASVSNSVSRERIMAATKKKR